MKTNSLILSKYPTKYLKLVFVLINFEIAILSTLTTQISIGFFLKHKTLILLLLSLQISTLLYYEQGFRDYFLAN